MVAYDICLWNRDAICLECPVVQFEPLSKSAVCLVLYYSFAMKMNKWDEFQLFKNVAIKVNSF